MSHACGRTPISRAVATRPRLATIAQWRLPPLVYLLRLTGATQKCLPLSVLAELKARGAPALVNTNASSGTRVCVATAEHGLDIAGTVFRLGGEPLTAARTRVVAATGSRAASIYGRGGIGRVGGVQCGNPEAVDDVYLPVDKLGNIQRSRCGSGAARCP